MIKKIIRYMTVVIAWSFAVTAFAVDNSNASFTPAQQKAIQQIVHDYLVNQPEVLVEASDVLQKKQMEQAKIKAISAINQNKQTLFSNPNSPVAGNPNGDVVLVEFFDYNCGHCKAVAPVLESIQQNNPNLKIIYKEFPIFGGSSAYAAKAALAAAKQNKYVPFHNALFNVNDAVTEAKVLDIAKENNINIDQLKKDMDSDSVKQALNNNLILAKALGIDGTPSFVLSNNTLTQFDFIPGAVPAETLQQEIDKLKGTH